MSWEAFKKKFANVTYDAGYGTQRIASDLVVVGDNWWLERDEYDGSEWWEYKTMPVAQEKQKPLERVRGWWNTLEELLSSRA